MEANSTSRIADAVAEVATTMNAPLVMETDTRYSSASRRSCSDRRTPGAQAAWKAFNALEQRARTARWAAADPDLVGLSDTEELTRSAGDEEATATMLRRQAQALVPSAPPVSAVPPSRRAMTEAAEPEKAQDIVDRLEDEILDLDRAAGDVDGPGAEDTAGSVPGAPEPPD